MRIKIKSILKIVFAIQFIIFLTPVGALASYQEALQEAYGMAQKKNYTAAAAALFNLVRRPELKNQRGEIYLNLGKILIELNLPQVAAWQFVNVITSNDSKNFQRAVSMLMVVADELGDKTILNYAFSKIKLNEFPAEHRDMLYYRMGEVKFDNQDYKGATQAFDKVSDNHRYYEEALYYQAMSYAHLNETEIAIDKFQQLLNLRKKKGPIDDLKLAATLGLARTYYQMQKWDKSISYYLKIPRDHEFWHQSLFESTWAFLRSGRIRSSLGNFQSIHSDYYSDIYNPEYLILRSIVYLFICQYDELEKVLKLYEENYGRSEEIIGNFLRNTNEPLAFYGEVEKGLLNLTNLKNNKKSNEGKIPYNIQRYIIGRGNVSNNLNYLRKLFEEKKEIENMSYSFTSSNLGKYSIRLIENRIKNTKAFIGIKTKAHLVFVRAELKDLNEQVGFLRYELINLQKEKLQMQILGQKKEDPKSINEDVDREFYVKNGYEYYPFRGEFWLDEIGNYFYIGKNSCEKK